MPQSAGSTPSVWRIAAEYWDPAPEGGDAAEDRELAIKCSKDLRIFIREAWPLLEPARPFVANWHIDIVCEHLMAVSAGEIPRLLINQPPNTSKSISVSVCWPAWDWMLNPHLRWMYASYSQTFAFRDSRKTRDLIQSRGGRPAGTLFERRGYQGVLALLGQGWQLAEDQNAKGRYDTTAGGFRLATGIGGGATGDHGDRIVCLDGDTLIDTSRGPISIREIVEQRLPVLVRGSSGRWQKISKYEVSPGRPLLEIETADGARLRCTDDHPIYLEGHGWRPAGTVTSLYGDLHMRRLRGSVSASAGPRGSQHERGVLLEALRDSASARATASELDGAGGVAVQTLRRAVSDEARGGVASPLLLDGLCIASRGRAAAAGVRDVRRVVHRRAIGEAAILWPGLRGDGAPEERAGDWQRALHPRGLGDGLRAGLHGQAARGGARPRPQPLRDVRGDGPDPSRAPHRRLEGQSHADEPGHRLHSVPSQGAHEDWDQRHGDAPVRIVAVRCCGTPDAVYNLRVEPDHDYYANGLLVHNCDDPLNPEQAYSDADRGKVNRWWDGTMKSRFIDESAAAVIVHQRLHSTDLTGHLLAAERDDWHHLFLPAEYMPGHQFTYPAKATLPSGRVIDGDPRTEAGELLDPIRLSEATLASPRKTPSVYAGQYQQLPAPEGGGMFKEEWWARRWEPGFDRYLEHGWDRVVQSWDMAFKGTKTSDFVTGQVWGFHGADCYLLAQVRGRFDFAATLHVVKALTDFEPRALAKLVEDKANGPAVVSALRRKIPGLIEVTPKGSKYARAQAESPRVEAGNVILPAAITIPCPPHYIDEGGQRHSLAPTTVADYIHEHAVFPNGANDDMIDCQSQVLTWANPRASERVAVMPEQAAAPTPMSGVLTEKW